MGTDAEEKAAAAPARRSYAAPVPALVALVAVMAYSHRLVFSKISWPDPNKVTRFGGRVSDNLFNWHPHLMMILYFWVFPFGVYLLRFLKSRGAPRDVYVTLHAVMMTGGVAVALYAGNIAWFEVAGTKQTSAFQAAGELVSEYQSHMKSKHGKYGVYALVSLVLTMLGGMYVNISVKIGRPLSTYATARRAHRLVGKLLVLSSFVFPLVEGLEMFGLGATAEWFVLTAIPALVIMVLAPPSLTAAEAFSWV